MKKKKQQWFLKHKHEYYTKLSKLNKLRSRAWYKIKEINNKFPLLKIGFNILELGSSPGGWSQYIISKIGSGKLICFDKNNMKYMSNISFFQKDINNIEDIVNNINTIFKEKKFNVIVSDICTKLSGIRLIDINYHITILHKLTYLCKLFLVKNGSFVVKIFNGEEFKEYLIYLKKVFLNIFIFKPTSSLYSSSELYIIGKNYLSYI